VFSEDGIGLRVYKINFYLSVYSSTMFQINPSRNEQGNIDPNIKIKPNYIIIS